MIVMAGVAAPVTLAASPAGREAAAGWGLLEKKDWTGAEAAFRRAIEIDPALAEGYRGLAEALLPQGREKEAARAIEEGLPHLGEDPATLGPLAEILSRNDSTRGASLPLYRTLVKKSPNDAPLRLKLARNLAWSGHHDEALAECRRLQAAGTPRAVRDEARLLEAQVLSWSGRSRESEARYRGILADRPSAGAHVGMGDIARWEERYADAEAHYRDALKLDPGDPRAVEGLRRNHHDAGATLTARSGWFDDSSDFQRRSYSLFADLLQMKPLSVRVGAVRAGYEDAGGGSIDRTALAVQGRYWAGRSLSLRGGLALNRYDDDAPDTTSWFLHGDLSPGADRVRIRLGYHHYDLIDESDPFLENRYNQARTVDVARQSIDIDEIRAGMLARLTGRLSLNSDAARGDISDGNERFTAYSRLSYRLPGKPRVDLFGAFYYQSVRDDSVLYWDPSNFQSYALGARVEGDGGTRFHYVAEGQLAFHPLEESLLGWQVHGVAEWELSERYSLRLMGNHLVAPVERGGGNRYDATFLSAGLVARFGARPPGAPAATGGR